MTGSSGTGIDAARRGLRGLGYVGGLLQENYQFADVVTGGVRTIALAAFGQEPPSYRTACIGVTFGHSGQPTELRGFRDLGAPQILAVDADEVRRWKMRPAGQPELLERFPAEALERVLRERRDEWGPGAVLRAKAIRLQAPPIQPDFFDAGLLPAIEEVVQEKLDALLNQAIAATDAAYREHHEGGPDFRGLCRLIFRFLAAKVLTDRRYPDWQISNDPAEVIAAVESFYFQTEKPGEVLADPHAQAVAWRHIREGFHFQNISVETLAGIYENTLVDPDLRREQSIHGTPPALAEYIVRRLPFDLLPEHERTVFEPFAGNAVFLTAALGRLRELLPPGGTNEQRHAYFIDMLTGMERDPFAIEVARLSLMLADYPNPNGWRLHEGDVFASPQLRAHLAGARIVLCNPPFEDFGTTERRLYPDLATHSKAAEILSRTLEEPPAMLGFVLPRVFRDGQSYRSLRRRLVELYRELTIIDLPDVAFAHSGAETVVVLAHGLGQGPVRLSTLSVQERDYARFVRTAQPTWRADALLPQSEAVALPALWLYQFERVWAELRGLPRLEDVAAVHRGIEYRLPLKRHRDDLMSDHPRAGFAPGLAQVTAAFEPYRVLGHSYLNMDPAVMLYQAYKLRWDQPKVIVNAARISRGPWTVVAVPDDGGLVCYQRFQGVWPMTDLPLEVLAAVLNGPVANAFVSERRSGRDNQIRTLEQIPVPRFSARSLARITELVGAYRAWRLASNPSSAGFEARYRRMMLDIDAEVLGAYDLPPRLERALLKYFDEDSGPSRPGPGQFGRYYPPSFGPALPLAILASGDLGEATARRTLARLPILRDSVVSEVVAALGDESSGRPD